MALEAEDALGSFVRWKKDSVVPTFDGPQGTGLIRSVAIVRAALPFLALGDAHLLLIGWHDRDYSKQISSNGGEYFFSAMKVMIARLDLARMVALTRNLEDRHGEDTALSLWACGGKVYVEANDLTCGWEALVFEEGICRLSSRKRFGQVLSTFKRKRNLTLEAAEGWLTIERFRMTLDFYSTAAADPSEPNAMPVQCLRASVKRLAPLEPPPLCPPESSALVKPVSAHSLAFATSKVRREAVRSWIVVIAANEKELARYRQTLTGATYDLEFFSDGHCAFEWMQKAKFTRAVLVLNDLATPGVSVIPLIRQVCAYFPAVAVVLCTVSRALAVQAFDAGAFAVVREPAPASAFLGTLLRAWQCVPLRQADSLASTALSSAALTPPCVDIATTAQSGLQGPMLTVNWRAAWTRLLAVFTALLGGYRYGKTARRSGNLARDRQRV